MEIEKGKRRKNLFLQGFVFGLLIFIAKCFGYSFSAADYLRYCLLYTFGFSAEWLADGLDILVSSLSTVFILLFIYIKGYIYVLKNPKSNKNAGVSKKDNN